MALVAIGVVMVYSASSIRALLNSQDPARYGIAQAIFAAVGLSAMFAVSRIDFRSIGTSPSRPTSSPALLFIVLIPSIGTRPADRGAGWTPGHRWLSAGRGRENRDHPVPRPLARPTRPGGARVPGRARSVRHARRAGLHPHPHGARPRDGRRLCRSRALGVLHVGRQRHRGDRRRQRRQAAAWCSSVTTRTSQPGHDLPRPRERPARVRLQRDAGTHGPGHGRARRGGPGRQPPKVRVSPGPVDRLHLRHHRRGVGPDRDAVVLLLFVVIAWQGYRIAVHAPDTFSGLLAAGITTWLVAQAVINMMVVTALWPVTGIPLPFISYGGTALIINLAAVGVLLSISREAQQGSVLDALGDLWRRDRRAHLPRAGRRPGAARPASRG